MTNAIDVTFTQCKQIIGNGEDLREVVAALNDQPKWLESITGITSISELQSILQSGVAANAHRCVYYYDASETMHKHGTAVIEYLENRDIESINFDLEKHSWQSFASEVLSIAVEEWCSEFANALADVNWD